MVAPLLALTILAALGIAGVLFVRGAIADGPPWFDHRFSGHRFDLPPKLDALADLPVGERFAHFRGAAINLTDRDGNPLVVHVTPGTVTAVDAGSLTLATNDGSTRTFTLNNATAMHGERDRGSQGRERGIATDDTAVVLTLNDSSTASVVVVGAENGFGPRGRHWGPFGWGR
jgi:hypothetical protein